MSGSLKPGSTVTIATAAQDTNSGAKRLRVGEERKHCNSSKHCNSIQLVSAKNLPLSCEHKVLSFLNVDDLGCVALLSADLYALAKGYFSGLRCFGHQFLGRKHAWDKVAPVAADCIMQNQRTLERVEVSELTLSMLSALACCKQLAFNLCVQHLIESAPALTTLNLGRPWIRDENGNLKQRWLTTDTIRTIMRSGAPVKTLSLASTNAAEACELSHLTALEALTLETLEDLPADGFLAALGEPLSHLRALRTLEVESDDDEPAGVWRLAPSLTSLKLRAVACPHVLASGLREAAIPFTPEVLLSVLSSNCGLTKLDVREQCVVGNEAATVLLQRTLLTDLSIDSPGAPAALVYGLPKLFGLTALCLRTPAVHPSDLTAVLASLPRLKSCYLYGAPCALDTTPQLPPLRATVSLPALTNLDLESCDDSLSLLAVPDLEKLELGEHCRVSPSTLATVVRSSPSLGDLRLRGRAFTDRHLLDVLPAAPALELLALCDCSVTVLLLISMATLRLCPKLRIIAVRDCFAQVDQCCDLEVLWNLVAALPCLYQISIVGLEPKTRIAVEKKLTASGLNRQVHFCEFWRG